MSALEQPDHLDDALIDALTPVDAPSDDDIERAQHTPTDDTDEASQDRVQWWTPTDADAADWVARKAQKAHRQVVRLQEQRDRLVAQADAWLERERARHDRTIEWAEAMLRLWLDTEIDSDDSKKPRKSRDLPCGVTVKRTPGGKSLVVEDEDALIQWLDDNYPECLNHTPRKGDVKKLLAGDGLAVPGVTLEQSPDGFKLDLGGA